MRKDEQLEFISVHQDDEDDITTHPNNPYSTDSSSQSFGSMLLLGKSKVFAYRQIALDVRIFLLTVASLSGSIPSTIQDFSSSILYLWIVVYFEFYICLCHLYHITCI